MISYGKQINPFAFFIFWSKCHCNIDGAKSSNSWIEKKFKKTMQTQPFLVGICYTSTADETEVATSHHYLSDIFLISIRKRIVGATIMNKIIAKLNCPANEPNNSPNI